MGEDASLEDFLDTDGETGSDGADSESASTDEAKPADETATAAEAEPTDEATPTDGVAPATTTYAWDGAGAACGSCGEVVDRRWQQDGELVCVTCKSW